MTFTLESFEVRNADNNATITIAKQVEKFSACPYWCVYVKPDGSAFAHVLRDWLKNKPSKRQIQNYIDMV